MSALHFDADIDDQKLASKVNKIDSDLHNLALKAANSGSILDNSFKKAGQSADDFQKKTVNAGNAMASIGALVSLSLIAGFAKEIANVRGEWQKYEAVLTNTLGSNEDAKDSLDMIAKYGAKTNFQVNELTDSFVKLASQGFKPTKNEMSSLGDLAASKAKGFNQLTEALIDAETFEFERLKEFGIRAAKNGEQIQFTFKGVKTTVDASAESVRNYILSLGQLEGVKGSTDAISKTIVGMASNFEDAWNQMLNSIGKGQEGLIGGSIQAATTLVNNYEKILDAIKALVLSYGIYKAASIALTVIETYRAEMMVTKMILSTTGLHEATVRLTFAQWASVKAQTALNTVSKANIYIAVASAIAGLIAMLVMFSDKADEAAEAQKRVNEQVNTEKAKIETLVTIIKSETAANADRAKALKELNDILPNSVGLIDAQTLSTKEGKKAIDDYIDSVKKRAKLEDLQGQLAKNANEQERIASGDFTFSEKFSAGLPLVKTKSNSNFKNVQNEYLNNLKEQEKQIRANIVATVAGEKAEENAGKTAKSVSDQILESKKKLTAEEKKLKEMRKSTSTSTPEEIKKQEGIRDNLKEQLKILTGIDEKKKKTIDDRIKALEEKLKTLKGDEYNQAIKQLILLEKQRDVQSEMLEMERKIALNKGITSITTRKANEDIARMFGIDVNKKTPTKNKADFEGEKMHANLKKLDDEQTKADDKKKERQKQLISGAYDLTNQYIEQLDLTESQARSLQGMVDVAANLATGNYIQAGFSALSMMMSGQDYSDMVFKAFAKQLEVINGLLNDNQRLIDQSSRSGGQSEAYKQRLELLKKQEEVLIKQVALAEQALRAAQSDNNSLFGWLFGSTKNEDDALSKAKQDLQETKNLIEDTKQEWDDFIRGGLTENTIADSIAQGFQDGKTSVKDFAEFVNDMLFDAVLSVFKAEILGPEITALSEFVKGALSDNVLSSEDIAKVNSMTQDIIEKNKPLWDGLTSALNLSKTETNRSPLTGSIAGASEETMSMVAGLNMTLVRDTKINQNIMQDQLELMDASLAVFQTIANNTKGISRLENIEYELKSMNENIKKMQ